MQGALGSQVGAGKQGLSQLQPQESEWAQHMGDENSTISLEGPPNAKQEHRRMSPPDICEEGPTGISLAVEKAGHTNSSFAECIDNKITKEIDFNRRQLSQ
ncbi:hypothetical protein H920_04361 [Fukomys damarensis]|uniref:Uncharacterized protein n=1 Tax=Fukomys damarensis TaxID=885580 RepID=A0A091DT49_FUKDA|nr:hypothetical protein H920_04361 [Fukomys damarensis]